jgi:hypothetical protein
MRVQFIAVSQNAEDRPHPRVDCRAGVMLDRLCALREWLLRRNRRPRHALGSRVPRPSRRVLVGILCESCSAPAWPLVAPCPSRRLAGTRRED